jgi:hypothetical protein
MAKGEGAGADRSVDLGTFRHRDQPGQRGGARPHAVVQHLAAGDEHDREAVLRLIKAAIGHDAGAVRRADRLDRFGDKRDLIAVGGRDVAVGLHEHVYGPGDIERLHAFDHEDGNGPGRHRHSFPRPARPQCPRWPKRRSRWPETAAPDCCSEALQPQ